MAIITTVTGKTLAERERAVIAAKYESDKDLHDIWSKAFVSGMLAMDLHASIAETGGGVQDSSVYEKASTILCVSTTMCAHCC